MTTTVTAEGKLYRLVGTVGYAHYDSPTSTWTPPGPPGELLNARGFLRSTTKTSVSSPGWNKAGQRYVRFPLARKPLKIKPPVEPVLRLLVYPHPPVRRTGSADSSFRRAMRKYGAILASIRLKNDLRLRQHAIALGRYTARKERYDRILRNYVHRIPKQGKKAIGRIIPSTNNPYSKTVVEDGGWEYINYLYYISGAGMGIPVSRYYERSYNGFSQDPMMLGGGASHPVMPSLISATDLINDATGKAINQLFNKLGDASANIGNMIAERAQTYNLFLDAFSRLNSFLKSPKKTIAGYVFGKGVSKRVANDHLQYCFGVEPLAKDVYDLAYALSAAVLDVAKHDMVKVRSGGSASDSSGRVLHEGNFTEYQDHAIHVRVRYMCEYRIDNSSVSSLNRFGLLNPASVLWEVTPWSFVVDWFLPIGNFISQLSADCGLSFREGTMSIEITETKTSMRVYKSTAWQEMMYGEYLSGSIKKTQTTTTKTREVLHSPPLVRLPRFKNPFSIRHTALSMSLWRQRK